LQFSIFSLTCLSLPFSPTIKSPAQKQWDWYVFNYTCNLRLFITWLQLFGEAVLGKAGLVIFSLITVTQMFGTVNAALFFASRYGHRSSQGFFNLIVSPPLSNTHVHTYSHTYTSLNRELFVASREGWMPQFLSGVQVTHRTPILSILAIVCSKMNWLFSMKDLPLGQVSPEQ
jgi:amino acid transporter